MSPAPKRQPPADAPPGWHPGWAREECRNCHTWWRHSDRVGCCTQCGRAFRGLRAFDAHRHVTWCDDASQDPRYELVPDDRGPIWALVLTETEQARLARMRSGRSDTSHEHPDLGTGRPSAESVASAPVYPDTDPTPPS